MKREDFIHFTDAQIVQFFRDAALERAKCGFNAVAGNRIVDTKMVPAYRALAERGPQAARELLALTRDPDANVRVDAAMFAYDADPTRCSMVLKKLIGEHGRVGFAALVWLVHKDPEFAALFSRQAEANYRKYLEEGDRKEPPPEG